MRTSLDKSLLPVDGFSMDIKSNLVNSSTISAGATIRGFPQAPVQCPDDANLGSVVANGPCLAPAQAPNDANLGSVFANAPYLAPAQAPDEVKLGSVVGNGPYLAPAQAPDDANLGRARNRACEVASIMEGLGHQWLGRELRSGEVGFILDFLDRN